MSVEKVNASVKEEITLKEIVLKIGSLISYLKSKWLIIAIAGMIGGGIGLTYSIMSNPIYTAKTTFVLEEGGASGGGLGQYAGLASMVGIDLPGGGGGIFQGDNILELYKSRSMVEKTLLTKVKHNGNDQFLIDVYVDINNLRAKWNNDSKLKDLNFQRSSNGVFSRVQDSVISSIVKDIIKNNLSVGKPDKKLSIISAQVQSQNEFFAKAFNEQIVKNVSDFYVQTKSKKAADNVAILEQKTDSVRRVMNGAIFTAAVVSDATPNLNITRQVQRVAPMQRSQFNAEANKAILGELLKNLELSRISLRKETPLIQVIDYPVFPLDMAKLSKVKGIVVGAFIASFFVLFVLLIRRIIFEIVS